MAFQHGINTYKSETSFAAVKAASVGIPFFIGAYPCHTAKGFTGMPILANNFNEAKENGGYSDEWRYENGAPKWNLCQAMYSHFKLMGVSPAIFMNVFDPSKHKKPVPEAAFTVSEHIAAIPSDALNNGNLIVKSGENVLVKDTDYEVNYSGNFCNIELLEAGSSYSASELSIAYDAADPSAITAAEIENAVESVENCKSLFGVVPDLICAPGWSKKPAVAAVMAAKAPSVNGVYKAKAVVDLDTSESGADDYSKVLEFKNKNGYTDENMIVCWPMVKSGDYVFDLSAVICGLMANVDTDNGGCPIRTNLI